ncbi:MAG: NIL domain-containing protein [Actinomycetota bacterium]
MARRRYRMTFPEDLITEPVIFNMGRLADVVTNIRRANVEARAGWVVLEIEGAESEIRKAIDYAAGLGVEIDAIGGDVLEG